MDTCFNTFPVCSWTDTYFFITNLMPQSIPSLTLVSAAKQTLFFYHQLNATVPSKTDPVYEQIIAWKCYFLLCFWLFISKQWVRFGRYGGVSGWWKVNPFSDVDSERITLFHCVQPPSVSVAWIFCSWPFCTNIWVGALFGQCWICSWQIILVFYPMT